MVISTASNCLILNIKLIDTEGSFLPERLHDIAYATVEYLNATVEKCNDKGIAADLLIQFCFIVFELI